MKISLTKSQNEALKKLEFFYSLKKTGAEAVAGVSVRPIPLVVGPSGCGKTFLAKHLADLCANKYGSVGFYSINISNWVVRAARAELASQSIFQVIDFVTKHDSGILLLDEVNKARENHMEDSAWVSDLIQEIYAIIDCDTKLLSSFGFTDQIFKKFRKNFLIIGSAAFQNLLMHDKSMGFGMQENKISVKEKLRKQNEISDELIFRFNEDIVVIDPPLPSEFRSRITAIRRELKLSELSSLDLDRLVEDAVASKRMFRWLEIYLGEAIREAGQDGLKKMKKIEGISFEENIIPASAPKYDYYRELTEGMKTFKEACDNLGKAASELEFASITKEADIIAEKVQDSGCDIPDIILGIDSQTYWLPEDALDKQVECVAMAAMRYHFTSLDRKEKHRLECTIITGGGKIFYSIQNWLRVHPTKELGHDLHRAMVEFCLAYRQVKLIYDHLMALKTPAQQAEDAKKKETLIAGTPILFEDEQ